MFGHLPDAFIQIELQERQKAKKTAQSGRQL